MDEIFGAWNERWSTATLFNVPRLAFIYPLYLLSKMFNYSGPFFMKSFITVLILTSAISMYLFSKRIVSIYFSKRFNFFKVFALITGAIFYAINPWVVMRIQHIYLLCGYSLIPLVLMFFFNVFDPKFQEQLIPGYYIYSRKLHKRNIMDIFLLSIFFTISAGAIHYFFYDIIFMFIIGVLIVGKTLIKAGFKNKKRVRNILINNIKKIILFASIFGCFSAYWLSIYLGSIVFRAQASQHNINVVDTLSLFSRNSSLKNVIYFISYWWPMFDISNLPRSFYLGGAIIIIFVFYAMIHKAYKYNIISFFALCTLIFLIASTGVSLDFFSETFIFIVSKTPIIGSMFRDPNKFVGLMAVGFSMLLTFGIQSFILKFQYKRYEYIIKTSAILIVITAFCFYLMPFYNHFINGFYSPITIPKEYLDVQDHLKEKDKFDSKVLYIPNADNMIQSYNGVATPYWNKNNDVSGVEKATGDIQVYSSQKNTIFQHEGNSLSINYYMNFIQTMIDNGMSKNMGKLISAFGVNEIAYHNEYNGQEARQKFNIEMLKNQTELKKTYENGIFTLYDIENNLPYLYNVPKKIITPYGYSRLESYSNIPNFNFKDYGVIFSSLEDKSYIKDLNKGDYIEANDYNDLLLSNLSKENYIYPFDVINDGDAFLKWSKTLVSNNDWKWHLSAQGLNNFPFDFDLNGGVALTYATSKLDVPANKIDTIKGKLIADFDSMLRTEKFFVPDNPKIFNVLANPQIDNNSVPVLYGEIMKGEPQNIWQVAKAGLLDAKENNPYKFNIVISGRGTNKMHVKVRFFDKQMNDLGTNYVVASHEDVNFDSVNFKGDYVSPRGSAYMRIELLSYQKPEQKNYWWIHDINIYDLGEYKKPNIFTMTKKVETDQKAKVYMRTLVSAKGGELEVKINDKAIKINTKDSSMTQFKWIELGEYKFHAGDNGISVENKEGFNAVNIFAFIPEEDFDKLSFPIKSAINRSNIFAVLEAENDFNYSGNIQSERTYPKLSMGKGISSQNGVLEKNIDIIKNGSYSFALNINGDSKNNGNLKVMLLDEQNNIILNKQIFTSDLVSNGDEKDIVVDKIPLSDTFPKTIKYIDNIINHYNTFTINNVSLTQGKYKIRILFDSKVPSTSTIADIHKFDPNEIKVPDNIEDIYDESNGDDSIISYDMMRDRIDGDTLHIDFDKTNSGSWYEYASKKISVVPDEEHLIKFDAISENVRKRHVKLEFLDKNNKLINVTYINDVDEREKNKWNNYQQIVQVPADAKYMQFHILCIGNKATQGFVEMKNYSIVPYKDFITLDNMIYFEGDDINSFFTSNLVNHKVEYERIDSMKRTFKISNPDNDRVLLNYAESPNPLWQILLGDFKDRGTLKLNGVTTGIITDQTGQGTIEIVLRKLYYFSFGFIGVGLVLSYIIFKRCKR
ncbi:hypothetical protein [Clostridium gasigenes]|uniref:hypothetical protein n=1 Tax=Clostridium gasigenes TaxID=94869 RepID=UPI00209B74CA|nr:hypothetical protein [Clostridium gasigenes]